MLRLTPAPSAHELQHLVLRLTNVDHDLAMDGRLSDFTAQFHFRKTSGGFRIVLYDIHVL